MGAMKKLQLKKQLGAAREEASSLDLDKECFLDLVDTHPFLRQFLIGWTEDGKGNAGGFLGIFVSEYGPKAMLTHNQESVKAFVTASDWSDLIQTLEEGLELQTLDWRPDGKKKAGGKKKG